MPLIVPILGMHRSGTSFVARVLHEAGVYLGESLMGVESSNLLGHWESWGAVAINEEILSDSSGSWKNPPAHIVPTIQTQQKITSFIQQLNTKLPAGWKDPRTTLTFPLWEKSLNGYCLIACFRHPLSVAHSLATRDGLPLQEGLDLWVDYNQALKNYCEDKKAEVFWFDYDADPAEHFLIIQAILKKLGLNPTARSMNLFNPHLKHHQFSGATGDAKVDDLYAYLKQKAKQQMKNFSSDSLLHSPLKEDSKLSEILDSFSALHQRIDRRLNGLDQAQARLWESVQRAERRLEALEAQAKESREFIRRIQGSFPFRLRRVFLKKIQQWKHFFEK